MKNTLRLQNNELKQHNIVLGGVAPNITFKYKRVSCYDYECYKDGSPNIKLSALSRRNLL